MVQRMEYMDYIVQHVDDCQRGFGVFNETGVEHVWICSSWQHPQLGLQIAVNHPVLKTLQEARNWIDSRLAVQAHERVIFARTKEEAESRMSEIVKSGPPVLPVEGGAVDG